MTHAIASVFRLASIGGNTTGYELRCRCGDIVKASRRELVLQAWYRHWKGVKASAEAVESR